MAGFLKRMSSLDDFPLEHGDVLGSHVSFPKIAAIPYIIQTSTDNIIYLSHLRVLLPIFLVTISLDAVM